MRDHCGGGASQTAYTPVRIRLHASPRSFRERVLKKCVQFPFYKPMAPFHKPPEWNSEAVTDGLVAQAKLNVLYLFVLSNIETELADAFGIVHEERGKYRGRGNRPNFMLRHSGGAPNSHFPASNAKGRRARLLQKRIEDARRAWNRKNPVFFSIKH